MKYDSLEHRVNENSVHILAGQDKNVYESSIPLSPLTR